MRNAFVFQERERCDLNLKSQLDTSMMVFDLRDVADSGQVGNFGYVVSSLPFDGAIGCFFFPGRRRSPNNSTLAWRSNTFFLGSL